MGLFNNDEQSGASLRKALVRATRDLTVSEAVARDAEAAYEVALEDAPDGDSLRLTRDKRDDASLTVRRQKAQANALRAQIAAIEARERAEKAKALKHEILEHELATCSALATAHACIVRTMAARTRLIELGGTPADLPHIPLQTYEFSHSGFVAPRHESLERYLYQVGLFKRSLEGAVS